MPSFYDRLKNGWNAFTKNKDPSWDYQDFGASYSVRPDRVQLKYGVDRTILASVFNRIALDVASMTFEHIYTDNNGRYLEPIKSGLNNVLTLSANIDQTGTSFIQDVVLSLFDEGYIAVVPVDTDVNPDKGTFDIETARVGQILQWYPRHIRCRVYNDRTGLKEELTLSKETTAIIENPFYLVMNDRNSTFKRLNRELNFLDLIDNKSVSGKLDLIIQLPYVIKTEAQRKQADRRRKDIEVQLSSSKYGIAYTDGTEHITQLNRPVENNVLARVERDTKLLFDQLSITPEILNGTANEETMLNYFNRTVDPVAAAIANEFNRKFLTQNARTRGQKIYYMREPFKLTPVETIAENADTFARNEILTSNEIRAIMGFKPSKDPKADMLINSNLNHPGEEPMNEQVPVDDMTDEEIQQSIAELDDFDSQLNDLEDELNG